MGVKLSVGVRAIITHNGKVLVGKRGPDCKTGEGMWHFPGGAMEEYDEDVGACAVRETQEETGLVVKAPSDGYGMVPALCAIDNRPRKDSMTFWVLCHPLCGDAPPTPMVMEPRKCTQWRWVTIPELIKLAFPAVYLKEQHHWTPIWLLRKFLPVEEFGKF